MDGCVCGLIERGCEVLLCCMGTFLRFPRFVDRMRGAGGEPEYEREGACVDDVGFKGTAGRELSREYEASDEAPASYCGWRYRDQGECDIQQDDQC